MPDSCELPLKPRSGCLTLEPAPEPSLLYSWTTSQASPRKHPVSEPRAKPASIAGLPQHCLDLPRLATPPAASASATPGRTQRRSDPSSECSQSPAARLPAPRPPTPAPAAAAAAGTTFPSLCPERSTSRFRVSAPGHLDLSSTSAPRSIGFQPAPPAGGGSAPALHRRQDRFSSDGSGPNSEPDNGLAHTFNGLCFVAPPSPPSPTTGGPAGASRPLTPASKYLIPPRPLASRVPNLLWQPSAVAVQGAR